MSQQTMSHLRSYFLKHVLNCATAFFFNFSYFDRDYPNLDNYKHIWEGSLYWKL
jgi:hypothetical protein